MNEDKFFYFEPFFTFNNKYSEYHIICSDDISTEYKANTRKSFWTDLLEYIKKNFNILEINIDTNSDSEKYIWIHIEKKSKDYIKIIIDNLNKNYEIWFQHKFPKLELLIQYKLNNKNFILNSIIEYQNINGYENTKDFIEKFYFLLK